MLRAREQGPGRTTPVVMLSPKARKPVSPNSRARTVTEKLQLWTRSRGCWLIQPATATTKNCNTWGTGDILGEPSRGSRRSTNVATRRASSVESARRTASIGFLDSTPATRDVLGNFTVTETAPPFSEVLVDVERRENTSSGWGGGNVGADVTYTVTSVFGLGGFVRFATGSVDIPIATDPGTGERLRRPDRGGDSDPLLMNVERPRALYAAPTSALITTSSLTRCSTARYGTRRPLTVSGSTSV